MQGLAPGAVLADTATCLNRRLAGHLREMARNVVAEKTRLDDWLDGRLRRMRYPTAQRKALAAITFGAAAPALASGADLRAFLEQVEYSGRRLAKLEVSPARVVTALRLYDELLDIRLRRRHPAVGEDASWARDQFHFLVVLALNNAFYQVREAESQAFYGLFQAEAGAQTLEEMLARFLSTLIAYTQAGDGRFYLSGAETGAPWLAFAPGLERFRQKEPPPCISGVAGVARPRCFAINRRTFGWVLEPAWRDAFRYCWSIPLIAGGFVRGIFQFAFAKPYRWLPREIALLKGAAERCWQAAEKVRLLESLAQRENQIRGLAARMLEVEESERRRISRELHDEAGQSLLCVRLQLEMIERGLPKSCTHFSGKLAAARRMTEHSIAEIRRLIADLSPAVLEHMGLAAALRQLTTRLRKFLPADVTLSLPRRIALPSNLQITIYRVVQEAFHNIVKYSRAGHVNLSLSSADQRLRLLIEDDGVGFDVEEAFSRRDCFGLSGLRERVALMGGVISIRSLPRSGGARKTPGGAPVRPAPGPIGVRCPGTAVVIEFPLNPQPDARLIAGNLARSPEIAHHQQNPVEAWE